jgi:hypothetical protein
MMPDYNFTGLSARSFEQMIQALSAKLLGPNTIIFGDGPDGGREATYEGPTSYGSGSETWNGYIVVQAKFRQRPESVAKDAAWALTQLASEIRKFQNRRRTLRRPEYYIFATNVPLTPVYKIGSKDRAYLRLNKLKEKLYLRGFDLWDYDKLRTFLDDSEDIRRAYGAWITPGDVLASLLSTLGLKHPNFDDVLTNFLQKELIADRYANLEQAGHTVEERVPLANVFVDLPALLEARTEPPEVSEVSTGFVQEIMGASRERFDNESVGRTIGSRTGLSTQGSRLGRYVLVGGPGQGKTTVGQFICQLFRASILKQKSRKALSTDAVEALREIEHQCESEELSIPIVRRFPIRIVLSEYAAHLNSHHDSLLSYIATRIQKKSGKQFTLDDFRLWLGSYPWVLILDGLDEVPASSNRDQLLNTIRDFWVDAADCAADILVLATTRPQGYNDDFSPKFYEHKYLTPLSNKHALHYAERLVKVRYEGEEARINKVLDRLRRACRPGSPTSRLMRSPLQVTIMTTLVDRVGQPPQERWNLFKDYYNVIYEREIERDTPAASLLRDYRADINTIHARVGLLLQVESEKTGRTDARLSLLRFKTIVRKRLTEEGHEGKALRDLEERLITAAMHRLVFLVGLEQDQIGFEVRSLQEFMAAEGLIQGSEADLAPRLRAIAPISHWRNVFLFAAGWCFSERQNLRDTIQAICAELNEDSDPSIKSVLAGSQLAVDLLEDGSARRQPKQASSLFRIAFRLLDLPQTEYQTKLGALYTPEFEGLFVDEIGKQLSQTNYEDQLGAWNALSTMSTKLTFVKELRNKYWPPEKVNSFRTIRYAGTQKEAYEKLFPLICDFSPDEFWEEYSHHVFRYGPKPGAPTKGTSAGWFRSILKIFNGTMWGGRKCDVVLRIPENQAEQVFRTALSSFTDGQLDWQIPFKDMPATNPSWQPFISAGQFLQNPTHLELATQLERLGECDLTSISAWKRPWMSWTSGLPWPISVCLTLCSAEQLLALAESARNGALGQLSDWRTAEQRWLSKGITFRDIEHVPEPPLPFDHLIGEVGFPFEAKPMFSAGYNNPVAALDVFDKLASTRISADLALSVTWTLDAHAEYHLRRPPDYSAFRKLLSIIPPGSFVNVGALSLMFPEKIDLAYLENLEKIGREAAFLHAPRLPYDGFVKELWKSFMVDPNRVGLLKLISELATQTAIPEIPWEYVEPSKILDLSLRRAAITVLLTQKNLPNAFLRLAKLASSLGDQLQKFLSDTNAVIREQQIDSKTAERFLLSLLASVPHTERTRMGGAFNGLDWLVRSRKSHLDDPSVWNELHFPPI